MKIVIMAGGKGTRIAQVNATVPKPMIPIEGKPILEYQIETVKKSRVYRYYINCGSYGKCNPGVFW